MEEPLTIGDDKWRAVLAGYSIPSRRLELWLGRERVGPVVVWADDVAMFQGDLSDKRTHPERPRANICVRWQLKGSVAVVAVDYADRGRAAIRATVEKLGKWE